jgi:hypothetical protein
VTTTGGPVQAGTFVHVALFYRGPGEYAREVCSFVREGLSSAEPALLPVLRACQVGPDLGLAGGNFESAVVAGFDDLEGYRVYRDNPEHREIIGTFIQPKAAQRAAVRYEF